MARLHGTSREPTCPTQRICYVSQPRGQTRTGKCGRSSVVECHLAKVNVEGSNPFARFEKSQRKALRPSVALFRRCAFSTICFFDDLFPLRRPSEKSAREMEREMVREAGAGSVRITFRDPRADPHPTPTRAAGRPVGSDRCGDRISADAAADSAQERRRAANARALPDPGRPAAASDRAARTGGGHRSQHRRLPQQPRQRVDGLRPQQGSRRPVPRRRAPRRDLCARLPRSCARTLVAQRLRRRGRRVPSRT